MGLRKIGLTGGVASGKSTVATILKDHGFVVVDMDALGREVTQSPEILSQIKSIFGASVFKDGQLDRLAMRKLIFSEPKRKQQLEAIIHPAVMKRFAEQCGREEKKGLRHIVGEAALLVESGHFKEFDELVVVTAPDEVRLQRLIERDRIDEDLARRIFSAQLPQEEKTKHATHVLTNDGDKDSLRKQVTELAARWK